VERTFEGLVLTKSLTHPPGAKKKKKNYIEKKKEKQKEKQKQKQKKKTNKSFGLVRKK